MNPPVIEFCFDFASNYSHLSALRIEALAETRGIEVRWRPFLLGAIFRDLGMSTSPFVEQKAKGEYTWRDMARQSAKLGVPWRRTTTFPRGAILPHRVALIAADEGWAAEYCRRTFLRNFVEDRDLDSPEAVREVLAAMDRDADAVIAKATTDATKARLRAQTATAQARGIFGAPTFFVGGEMFWGNDRLEDALEWAAGEGWTPPS